MGNLCLREGLYLPSRSDAVTAITVDQLAGKSSPLSSTPTVPLSGSVATLAEGATAFSTRSAAPGRPNAIGSGSYISFMTEFEDDRARATFGATKYAPLAEIKTKYDPDNVFHHNPNIKPKS